ncbi:MAG: RnfABCDGE type electron transport complex subunit G [Prevotellaceae bacterium]|nr:RnfABCDGE type electron transport complex subunit G [Prevotellaceae bacterium]
MKKLESTLTNMVVVLVAVAVITGALLAWVNHVTEAPIKLQDEMALANGIKEVMGTSDLKVTSDDEIKKEFDGKELSFIVHKTADKDGKFIGAAVESTTMGFGGELKVLVGFDAEGKVLGYTILQAAETPGLGAKADKWFQKDGKGSIIGKQIAGKPLTVNKDGGDIDAITASTITSRAFLKAVNQAYNVYAGQDAKGIDGKSGASPQKPKEKE